MLLVPPEDLQSLNPIREDLKTIPNDHKKKISRGTQDVILTISKRSITDVLLRLQCSWLSFSLLGLVESVPYAILAASIFSGKLFLVIPLRPAHPPAIGVSAVASSPRFFSWFCG